MELKYPKGEGLDSITAVKTLLATPLSPEITISNNVTGRSLGSILNEIPAKEQEIERGKQEAISYAKRRWKDTQELIDNIKGITNEFENNLLSSLVFEGLIFRAGAAALQYRFLADDRETSAEPNMYFNTEDKSFYCPASRIVHETLNIDGQKPYWVIPEYRTDTLDAAKPYYLYLKCSKDLAVVDGRLTGDAIFFISDEKIKIDDLDGFYTLWVAFINSENEEGDRSFTTMYGLAELLPGQLTVDTIRSSDGGSYWKALKNQFKLGDGENGMDYNISEENTLTITNAVVRNALKVAGSALIAGFNFYNDRIDSTKTVTYNNNEYPALRIIGNEHQAVIELRSVVSKWAESKGTTDVLQTITLDSSNGEISSRTTDGDVCTIDSQGVFANRAGINTLPATAGVELKASIAGLGRGKMDKSMWGSEWGVVGVYGTASNDSKNPAPAYGGWFDNLKVNGLVLNTTTLSNTSPDTILTARTSMVVSFASSQKNVYLPAKADRGTTLFLKQLNPGSIKIYPNTGQRLYDDSTPNDYIDVGEGWTAMCVFIDNVKSGTESYDVWIISKFKL
jgi:hypothetical protein